MIELINGGEGVEKFSGCQSRKRKLEKEKNLKRKKYDAIKEVSQDRPFREIKYKSNA